MDVTTIQKEANYSHSLWTDTMYANCSINVQNFKVIFGFISGTKE